MSAIICDDCTSETNQNLQAQSNDGFHFKSNSTEGDQLVIFKGTTKMVTCLRHLVLC